jgi:hypothetical protein
MWEWAILSVDVGIEMMCKARRANTYIPGANHGLMGTTGSPEINRGDAKCAAFSLLKNELGGNE